MLKKLLQKYFGFNSFLKGQEDVIHKVLDHQSAAAIFPTGAGKSLCYQLPAMVLPGMTLVVSPLLSLMKDQLDFLLESNILAARLDSTLQKNEYNAIIARAKNNGLKILMISVERFKNERFRSNLEKMSICIHQPWEYDLIIKIYHFFRLIMRSYVLCWPYCHYQPVTNGDRSILDNAPLVILGYDAPIFQ